MAAARTVVGSVARGGDFVSRPPELKSRPRELWATGDFVVYKATGTAEGLLLARAQDGDEDTAAMLSPVM